MPDPVDQVKQSLQHLLETYNELNSSHIDELDDEPSALEFYRYVAQNRPFVARGGCSSWSAMRKWNAEYLDSVVGGKDVNVAITPLGSVLSLPYSLDKYMLTSQSNADAVVEMPDGSLTFVKPLERMEKFKDVLQFISSQELTDQPKKPIKYAQTRKSIRSAAVTRFDRCLIVQKMTISVASMPSFSKTFHMRFRLLA